MRIAVALVVLLAFHVAPVATVLAQGSSTRDNPVPFGVPAEVGDWTVRVTRVDFDAEQEVLQENQFNDPAEPGQRFVLARIEGTYNGDETGNLDFGLSFKVVGESNVAYGESDPGCGVVPDDLINVPEVFPGGEVAGNACWSVPQSDIESIVMFAEPLFSLDAERVFFELAGSGADRRDVVEAAAQSGRAPRATQPPTTADRAPGGRANPIPLGQTARVGNWTIRVLRFDADATDAVLAENQFNDRPEPGLQFAMAQVAGRFEGGEADTAQLWLDVSFKVVGDNAVAYGGSDSGCGVIPEELYDQPEVFSGGVVSGNVCWSVPSDEVNSLVLMVEPSFSFDDADTVFFALE